LHLTSVATSVEALAWRGAYLIPPSDRGFVWHLILFEQNIMRSGLPRRSIIRSDLASMAIQSVIFSWVFPRFCLRQSRFDPEGRAALRLGAASCLVVRNAGGRCKHPMASISDYVFWNRLHDPAVRDRGTLDRAGLAKVTRSMRRNNVLSMSNHYPQFCRARAAEMSASAGRF